MDKKILVIGAGFHLESEFHKPVTLKDCDKPKVLHIQEGDLGLDSVKKMIGDHNGPVVIVQKEPTIIINGIEYKRRPDPERSKSSGKYSVLAAMMAMSAYGSTTKNTRPRPNVDIAKEFELIQQKKSTLGRNDRDWVESCFHKMYTPVKP